MRGGRAVQDLIGQSAARMARHHDIAGVQLEILNRSLDELDPPLQSRPGLDDRTRQLAAVATFAAMGMTDLMTVHARYALNIGVTEDELKEIVYMITVPAGFPRAIIASQALSKLFAVRAPATCSVATCESRTTTTP